MDLKIAKLRQEYRVSRKKTPELARKIFGLICLLKARPESRSVSKQEFSIFEYEAAALASKVSVRTLQLWKKQYVERGLSGLKPRPIPGRKPKAFRGWTVKLIKQMRTDYNWGAETIAAHLRIDYKIEISEWRINNYLRKNKFLHRKRRKKLKNKHTSIVQVPAPGQHTQMDVKYLPKIMTTGEKSYVYNFVDHASRWEHKRAFADISVLNTERFMREVILAAPFKILRLQTDNGVEFTNYFLSHIDNPRTHILDIVCDENGIKHRLIPPGEKELNGLVERSHRADDEEFYHRTKVDSIKQLNELLQQHCQFRNYRRRRKPLGWRTPAEWLAEYDLLQAVPEATINEKAA